MNRKDQHRNHSLINTRYRFGGFIGDYTNLVVDSNNFHHMDGHNNVQTVVWWCGFQFVPTSVHPQDVVTTTGRSTFAPDPRNLSPFFSS